jgi:hypothetical protein
MTLKLISVVQVMVAAMLTQPSIKSEERIAAFKIGKDEMVITSMDR